MAASGFVAHRQSSVRGDGPLLKRRVIHNNVHRLNVLLCPRTSCQRAETALLLSQRREGTHPRGDGQRRKERRDWHGQHSRCEVWASTIKIAVKQQVVDLRDLPTCSW